LLYLNFEKKHLDAVGSSFVVALYERAVLKHCFDPYIWISFIGFVATQKKLTPCELSLLCNRAIKNSFHCLSNSTLWSYRLRFANVESSEEQLDKLYQRGLYFVSTTEDVNQMSEFLITRLYIERRKLQLGLADPTVVRNLYDDMISQLDNMHDPDCKVQRMMAHIEAFVMQNQLACHDLFDKMVKKSVTYKVWLDWTTIAIELNDITKARDILKEAIRKPIDGMQELYEARIDFEMKYGDHDELHQAIDRVFFGLEKDMLNKKPAVETKPDKKKRQIDEEESYEKKSKTEELQTKVKAKLGDISAYQVVDKANAGQMIFLGDLPSNATIGHLLTLFKPYGRIIDCYIEPNDEGVLQGYVEFQNIDSVRKAVLGGEVTIGDYSIKPNRCRPAIMKWGFKNVERKDTIYISNLSSLCDKMILRNRFGDFGKIKDIRIQFKKNYAFAYVQFYEDIVARQACSLDQTELDNRLIGVHISNPAKKTVHELDETQLYVSNVAPSIIETDLQQVFGVFGKIKDIRLHRQGIKSFAYIHYETKVPVF
jgi:RNA recognition motif-containing protein